MQRLSVHGYLFGLIAACAIVACSSGSSPAPTLTAPPATATPSPTQTPSPTASPSPTGTPASESEPVVQDAFVATPIPYPTVAGYAGAITIPAGSTIGANSLLTLQSFAGEPSGGSVPQGRLRATATPGALYSLLVEFNEQEVIAGFPRLSVFTFVGPGFTNGRTYAAELFDTVTGKLVQYEFVAGRNESVVFPQGSISMVALANRPYLIEVVAGSALATPSPAPAASSG